MSRRHLIALALLLAQGCASVAPEPDTSTRAMVPEIRPGVLAGYIAPSALPNALAFLPPPPAEGSAAMAADRAASETFLAMQGSERFEQAARDVDLTFPGAETKFQCQLGTRVSEAETPALYRMLRRSMVDAGLATYSAKNEYKRARPFMANGRPTCTPETEAMLREDGSYPSGHSALGWAWGLLLSSLAPEQSSALLARGWAFGQSRAVCNVHWQSDVDAGRLVAAAVVAKLHTLDTFRQDFEAARAELESAYARGLEPAIGCDQVD